MDGILLAQIMGLALLDALNPATVAAVTLVLLSPLPRPLRTALGFVLGAYLVVLALGVLLLSGAGAAAELLTGATAWVRRGALLLAGVLLLRAAARRLRERHRAQVVLPRWVGLWTALPLGVLVTGADLPNAFPYLVAVERLVAADVPPATALAVLAGYALVYVGPCLALVAAAGLARHRVRARLATVYERLGAARTVPRSRRAAALLGLAGVGVLGLVPLV